tara:strand:+ start:4968 stop:6392 length:1425 start_codon:yes stop_codon:yes gene_type:complete
MTRKYNKWTPKMKAYLVVKKTSGLSVADITRKMNKKFNTSLSPSSVQQQIGKMGLSKTNTAETVSKAKVYFKPTQRQINFIHAMVLNGFDGEKIIEAYKEQFEFNLTEKHLAKALATKHTLEVPKKKKDKTAKTHLEELESWKLEPATRKQCRYIIGYTTDLSGSKKTQEVNRAFNEERWTKGEACEIINEFTVDMNVAEPAKISEPVTFTEPVISTRAETAKKNLKSTRWSEEEDYQLISHKLRNPRGSWPVMENRTRKAVEQRWQRVKKNLKPSDYSKYLPDRLGIKTVVKPKKAKTVEVPTLIEELDETVEEALFKPTLEMIKAHEDYQKKKEEDSFVKLLDSANYVNNNPDLFPNVAETTWTKEEDFDILCNFYEYSIDEARNRFNVPYSVIAGRLEMLIDSTEPDHIEMLMEATKAIKERRKRQAEEAKQGPYCRWKKRRKAKKELKRQAKIDKRIAKTERKLSKLKGD